MNRAPAAADLFPVRFVVSPRGRPSSPQAGGTLSCAVARVVLLITLLCIPAPRIKAAQPPLLSPVWTNNFAGLAIGCPMPYGDAISVAGILITERTGTITLVDGAGTRRRSIHLDLAADTPAVCGDPTGRDGPAVVAVDAWGSVYGFDPSGARIWKHERRVKSGEFRLPVVRDMDGDGRLEVVVGDSRGCIEVLDASGQTRLLTRATGYRVSVPAVGDLEGDGRCELVFGTEAGEVHAVDLEGRWRWSTQVEACLGRSFPLLADVDRDGIPEVYLSTAFTQARPGLFSLEASLGTIRWRAQSVLQSYRSTVVADLLGDGRNQIVFGDKSSTMFCLDSQGEEIWRRPMEGRGIFFAPAVIRLQRDGIATLFSVVRGAGAGGHSLYALDGRGAIVRELPLPGGGGGPPLACRLAGDDSLSLLVLSASGQLLRFMVEGSDASSQVLWPGPRNDLANSGAAVSGLRRTRLPGSPETGLPQATPRTIHHAATGRVRIHLPAAATRGGVACVRVRRPGGVLDVSFWRPDLVPADREAAFDAMAPGDYEVDIRWRSLRPGGTSGQECRLYRVADRGGASSSGEKASWHRGGSSLTLRQFSNPWQGLNAEALVQSAAPARSVGLRVLGRSYGTAAFALTRSGEEASRLRLTVGPFSCGERSVDASSVLQWHDVVAVRPDGVGEPVDDALPPLPEGSVLELSNGIPRKLWATVRSHELGAGTWTAALRIEAAGTGNASIEVPFRVEVQPVSLPERQVFRQCNWLYLAGYPEGPVREAITRDALEHGMNVFVIPGVEAHVDEQGRVVSIEGGTHDILVQRLTGRAFFLVTGPVSLRWPQGAAPDTQLRERAWANALNVYADHMASLGCGFDSFAIYLQDEPGLLGDDAGFRSWVVQVKRFKRDEPRLQLYANPAGGARFHLLQEVKGLVDVWAPDLHLVREEPDTMPRFFAQARHYWHYEAPGDQRTLDPLGFYRMKPWVAFQQGMTGGGFWVYSDAKLSETPPGGGSEYGTVYVTERGPLPTIRWEATREGIQDFELLTQLRDTAQRASPALRKRALAALGEAVAFVTAGQERVTDISRHVRPYTPDYVRWMHWRDRLIALQRSLEPAR